MYSSPSISSNVYLSTSEGHLTALSPLDGSVLWSTSCNGEISLSSPAVGRDETVYVGTLNSLLVALKNGIIKVNTHDVSPL